MDQPPRHFHAMNASSSRSPSKSRYRGAIPLAEFAGPLGPGGPALTFWTSTAGPADNDAGSAARCGLVGKIPRSAGA